MFVLGMAVGGALSMLVMVVTVLADMRYRRWKLERHERRRAGYITAVPPYDQEWRPQ